MPVFMPTGSCKSHVTEEALVRGHQRCRLLCLAVVTTGARDEGAHWDDTAPLWSQLHSYLPYVDDHVSFRAAMMKCHVP